MNLNPFVKFEAKCRLSGEQVIHRLSLVTTEQSMLSPSWRVSLFQKSKSGKRYVGKIGETRFTVTKPTDNTLAKILDIPYQNLVIHGKVRPEEGGCTVRILIRPTLNILLAWLVLPIVFLVLTLGVIPDIGQRESAAAGVFCLLLLFVASREYIIARRSERQFLEELFDTGTPVPERVLSPAP
ncbi:MAG: hypothetical protein JSU74_04825 [Candidatus Zixiibacteriota bacterium]|nr:MAG: hypothetical protein JSU74_04825 [candidate division Zixibacteria bacterium]